MLIPRISQVPIREPMYIDGVMTPTWLRFFEQLAALINTGGVADYVTLAQLANQMPTQAITGQMLLDQQQPFGAVAVSLPTETAFDLVPVHQSPNSTCDLAPVPAAGVIKT